MAAFPVGGLLPSSFRHMCTEMIRYMNESEDTRASTEALHSLGRRVGGRLIERLSLSQHPSVFPYDK
ncbi:transport protein particle (TRAPP) component, partial [Kipferlia bialata]|eukprot:g10265.t1